MIKSSISTRKKGRGRSLTEKIIEAHLMEGKMVPGEEIGLRIDQTLTQDATGTLVMLELEAMGLDRVKTELSAQYVDHNLIQEDYKNADDHLFLQSACQRYGIWYSKPGNGVSHPVHMQYFAVPGKTLLGSDSHTCASGCMGMLAIGAGGLEVAMAMAGHPYHVTMPKVFGVEITGSIPEWVSAKDVILELLKRHDVEGGVGYVIEYFGSGLKQLTAMDRHVIANMGAELGATSTVFPSDFETRAFLRGQGRGEDYQSLSADRNAHYDKLDRIVLDDLEPLIALPSSPGNVKTVREVAGLDLYQAYIGSSANPGFRDYAISAMMVAGKQIHPSVSYDINPSARTILEELVQCGYLASMIQAGGRIHQAGCNGCIGMGQAPATGRNSLRTVPRNFPGRSGTKEDSVYLCSPETATASALAGTITDPRDLGMPYPKIKFPKKRVIIREMLQSPLPAEQAARINLEKGPNIATLPELSPLEDALSLPILLKLGDNISTDEIMPAGARVLPFRSNIQRISDFCFDIIDEHYSEKARKLSSDSGHAVIAGENYGQGSSREHAALAPRFLGLRLVIAKSFARIHWENLVNFGILPLRFIDQNDYNKIAPGDILQLNNLLEHLTPGTSLQCLIKEKGVMLELTQDLSQRQCEIIKAGGLINWARHSGYNARH